MKVQLHPAYVVHPELLAAVEAVRASIARAKKIREIVDEAAKTVASLTSEEATAKQEMAALQVDEALTEDASVKKALRKAIDGKKADLAAKTVDLESAQLKIVELEKKAPSVDAEVASTGVTLRSEYQVWVTATKVQMSAEIGAVIQPLVNIMAKAKAIGWFHNKDFLSNALVPDPLTYWEYLKGMHLVETLTSNRLHGQEPDEQAQDGAAAIREQIAPVEQALAAVTSHRPYENLASRKKSPYERKGWGNAYYDRAGSDASSGIGNAELARAQQ